MGGKVGKVLPLVALAAVGVATGGFGLAGGAAATGAGAGAAASAPLALTPAGGVGAGLGAIAPTASTGGFFSTIASEWAKMSTMSKIGMGLSGLSSIGSMFGASAQADQQEALLEMEMGQQKLQNANDGLDLAQRSLDAEKRLSKTLAALNVRANAFGADLSSGSSANLLDSAYYDAQDELGLYDTRRQLMDQSGRTSEQTYAYKRRAIGSNRTGAMLGSLLDFGVGATKTMGKYSSVGRA